MTVSAALACILIGGQFDRSGISERTATVSAPPIHYQTGSGQNRRIRLRDGSTVVLGAETSLTVSLTRQRRSIHLVRGEAWFRVAHRPDWPFVVNAGRGTITDLGTAFVVDRDARRVEVTVTEGHVQIALSHLIRTPRLSGVRLEPVRLHRGQRFSYGADVIGTVRAANPHMALSWTSGELEFSDEPLRDVAANVNRYAPQPIAVSPAAGRLRLSTLVFSRHVAEWLDGLSRVLPVTVERTNVGICVRLRTRDETQFNNVCRKR
jgi:transmembrane sensor